MVGVLLYFFTHIGHIIFWIVEIVLISMFFKCITKECSVVEDALVAFLKALGWFGLFLILFLIYGGIYWW